MARFGKVKVVEEEEEEEDVVDEDDYKSKKPMKSSAHPHPQTFLRTGPETAVGVVVAFDGFKSFVEWQAPIPWPRRRLRRRCLAVGLGTMIYAHFIHSM